LSGFLLDTSVLSGFAPDRPELPKTFRIWLDRQGRHEPWYVPSIAAAEVQKGVAKLRRSGAGARADRLEQWLDELLSEFGERVLPVDTAVARRAGDIEDAAIARGRHPGLPDILIAATAQLHQLTILTSNTRHFAELGVLHFDPFSVGPP
jgi:predicted nucleic acid-binding protein